METEGTNVTTASFRSFARPRAISLALPVLRARTIFEATSAAAKALSDKMGKRVLEIDKREWNYKMETEVNLKRDAIKAWRDVGVAYGNGQPKSVAYNIIGWGR